MVQPIKPMSAKLAFLALAILLFVGSATFLDEKVMGLVQAIVLILAGSIALTEVGLKKLTSMSSMKELGMMEILTVSIGVIVLLSGVLALPFVPLQLPLLTQFSGMIGMILGIIIGIQAFI